MIAVVINMGIMIVTFIDMEKRGRIRMINKRITKCLAALVLAAVCALAFVPAQASAADDVKVYVNGAQLTGLDQPPVIINGRTMVPMRAIFEALGCSVDWYGEQQLVAAYDLNNVLFLVINADYGSRMDTIDFLTFMKQNPSEDQIAALVDNNTFPLDVPPLIINNRTMVPLRVVGESMDAQVDWDGNARAVYITQ